MSMDYSIQQQLFNVCGMGDARAASRLLSKTGVRADLNGYTALMYAAREGNTDCVNVLLPCSDIKAKNING